MTTDRRLKRRTGRGGRRFMGKPRKGTSRRYARLSNKRPGEGRGGRFHPDGLVTYTFSRLRCKPTASPLAVGLCSGAGVATRRARADQQDTMSDTSYDTTGGAQMTIDVTTERVQSTSRVVQGRPIYPGREKRRTAVGRYPHVQDVQGRTLFYQTNERTNGHPGQGGCYSKHIGENVVTLDILDIAITPPRRLSKIASRVETPTLDDLGRNGGLLQKTTTSTRNPGWSA